MRSSTCVILLAAASLNYIPGLTERGASFGVFALDIFDDALHVASASWGRHRGRGRRAAPRSIFLRYFGPLYLTDGLLGLATGSGYLDLGIVHHGVLDLPFAFKILANLPHIGLGGFAVFAICRWTGPRRHEAPVFARCEIGSGEWCTGGHLLAVA